MILSIKSLFMSPIFEKYIFLTTRIVKENGFKRNENESKFESCLPNFTNYVRNSPKFMLEMCK